MKNHCIISFMQSLENASCYLATPILDYVELLYDLIGW
jgi:hypothetical protein